MEDRATYYDSSRSEWRDWLLQNHATEKSGVRTVTYKEAAKEAMCFVWVYSLPNIGDNDSYHTRRSKSSIRHVS
ncbi:YdeI/OmpD-associated family protein [Portibacter marinus]|uniref:hypothetical protein n=1 Tax=Portibacter marinus TaxID=2898660 RepID=UPI001F1582C0|nr:hypothetical protein [Portibacter marinus]